MLLCVAFCRYWLFSDVVPGLYIEKGWVHESIDYTFTLPPEEQPVPYEEEEEEVKKDEEEVKEEIKKEEETEGTFISGTFYIC